MVQSIINLSEGKDRILNIVKAQHGLKNKSQAVEFVLGVHADSFLEPELRPEFVEKILNIDRNGKFLSFSSIEELKNSIENA